MQEKDRKVVRGNPLMVSCHKRGYWFMLVTHKRIGFRVVMGCREI